MAALGDVTISATAAPSPPRPVPGTTTSGATGDRPPCDPGAAHRRRGTLDTPLECSGGSLHPQGHGRCRQVSRVVSMYMGARAHTHTYARARTHTQEEQSVRPNAGGRTIGPLVRLGAWGVGE